MSPATIRRTSGIAFGVIALALLVTSALAYRTGRRLDAANTSVAHAYQVLSALESAWTAIVDADAGVRGFAVAGDRRYLEPFERADRELAPRIDAVSSLTADNPLQQRHVSDLRSQANATMQSLRQVISDVESHEVISAESSDRERTSIDAVRATLQRMRVEAQRVMAQRNDDVARANARTQVLLGALTAVGFGVLAASFFFVDRRAVQLSRLNDSLTERVRERTAAIESTRVEAQATAERLNLALSAGLMGVYEHDHTTDTQWWSPELYSLFGVSPEHFTPTNDSFSALVFPEDLDALRAAFRRCVAHRQPFVYEYRILRPDGDVRWLAGQGTIECDDDGNAIRHVGVVQDVTERKRADERFRLAVEAAPAAMLLVDEAGSIVLANAQAELLLGYTRDEIVGKPVDHLVPARFRGGHADDRRHFVADARSRPMGGGRELFALKKDGSEVPVEIGLSPIETTGGVLALAAVTDITERRRAEEALQFSEQQAKAFLNNSAIIAWLKDEDGRNVFLSDNYVRRFGLTNWHGMTDFELWPRDIAETFRRNDLNVLASDQPFECVEEARTPDGEVSFWLNSKFWFQGAAGRKFIGGVGVDITARKHAEQRGEQLRRVAEDANRDKDAFLARVSHELRTPLNALWGWARMLRDGQVPAERTRHVVDAIDRNAEVLKILVADLIEMSRLTAGGLQLNREHLDIAALARESLNLLEPAAGAKRIVVETDIESRPVVVNGDATRLRQVVWNLLSNAIKFTPADGRVTLTVRGSGDEIEIRVADNGQGIAPEFLSHVFEPFAQAERGGIGLGLGLAIVEQLVKAHGGRIDVMSPGIGAGAIFTVHLPVVRVPESSTASSPAHPLTESPTRPTP